MPQKRTTLIPNFARILHGGDYNPDQWLGYPGTIEEDFRLIPLSGCNTFTLGVFAWSSYEEKEGAFSFGWLDEIMDRMGELGNQVILATPSGAKPAWMAMQYPETRRVLESGEREPWRNRHNHCWTSPIYREKVNTINRMLAERYRDHPALGMWHLSNEYNGECHCELCKERFRDWLKQKYGDLKSLNHAYWCYFWSHKFTDWSQISWIDPSIDGLALDWRRFCSWQIEDFIRWESAPLREVTPETPITTNFMGHLQSIDYAKIAKAVDLVSDDQYPRFDPEDPGLIRNAVWVSFKDNRFRCFKKDRPWMLMETCPDAPQWSERVKLKRPRFHQLEMLQALGHGSEGNLYFQWRKGRGGREKLHGAVVDHVGHEHTRVFNVVRNLSGLYEKLTPVLGSTYTAEAAIIYDIEVDWALELSSGALSEGKHYRKGCLDHFQPFWERGINVDVIESDQPFDGYKLLIAPQLWLLKEGVGERLKSFVAKGGTLVSSYYTGICDATNRCFMNGWPGDGLRELFGIWNEETDVLYEGLTRRVRPLPAACLKQSAYEARDVCAILHAEGAETLMVYEEDFYAGTPVLTRNTFGEGTAYYLAAKMEMDFYREFQGALLGELFITNALKIDLPRGVSLQTRRSDAHTFYFFQNFTSEEHTLPLSQSGLIDLGSAEPVQGSLKLAPFGSYVVRSVNSQQGKIPPAPPP
jgi:beta-galactosidase